MRHLPKHLRPRYRYLAVEIETWPDAELDRTRFQAALWEAARALLGDAESAAVDLQVIEADFWTGGGSAIVRIRRGTKDAARAAVACLSTIDGHPVRVGVRSVGGTVNATESASVDRTAGESFSKQIHYRGQERSAVVRGDRVDIALEDGFVGTTREAL